MCNKTQEYYQSAADHPARTLDELLHHLWTLAVGTPGYDKREWVELELRIRALDE